MNNNEVRQISDEEIKKELTREQLQQRQSSTRRRDLMQSL